MFTKEELQLIEAALSEYYLKCAERKRADRKSNWHLNTMKKIDDLQGKLWKMVNTME